MRLVAVLALLLFIPLGASAQAHPDVVRLRDGSWLRGTISERTHAEVVIVLASGEVRRIPATEVVSAGPEGPSVLAPSDPSVPQHRVRVRGAPGLSLHVVTGTEIRTTTSTQLAPISGTTVRGTTIRGTGVVTSLHPEHVDVYETICTAPCERRLVESTYAFGIGRAGTGTRTVDGRFVLDRDLTLDLHLDDRSSWRAVGWTLVVMGAVGGGAMVLFADLAVRDGFDMPMLVGGLAGGVVMLIVGAALAALNDALGIDIVSDVPVSRRRAPNRRRSPEPDAF